MYLRTGTGQPSQPPYNERNTKLKTPMNTFTNFEIPLRHIKKYKDINLSIWCHNIFHPPFWVNPPPLCFTTENELMPNPSPFCKEGKHYGKFIRVITLNFIVIGGTGNKRLRWVRRAIWSFDTFNLKRIMEASDIEFRYLFHRTLNLMLVNDPFLLCSFSYHNR